MSDHFYDAAYFEELRKNDLASREAKRVKRGGKFLKTEGQIHEFTTLPYTVKTSNAGFEMTKVGADGAMTYSRPKRPDKIIQGDENT